MADESRDTRLLPEIARPWVDALGACFGPRVESRLIEAARPLVDQNLKELKVDPKSDDDRKRYVARVALVLAYHWWRFVEAARPNTDPSPVTEIVRQSGMTEEPLIQLEEVIERLKQGRPVYGPVGVDLLREVNLVEAVVQCDDRAAEFFLAEFRPAIETTLHRVGGKRAVDELDDVVNDLLVPRESKPPRLDNFHGKAPLETWLRTVIRRLWSDRAHGSQKSREDGKGKLVDLDETVQTDPNPSPEELAEYHDLTERGADLIVRQFLDLFASVADRDELLAWQMVCLEGIPQKDVAGLFQCHPSTISRYRERVEQKVNEAFANNDRLRPIVDALKSAPRAIVRSIAQRIVEDLRRENERTRDLAHHVNPDDSDGMDSALLRNPRIS
jgi:DNA-directed RNA polymerase specialized sigma24 family protein